MAEFYFIYLMLFKKQNNFLLELRTNFQIFITLILSFTGSIVSKVPFRRTAFLLSKGKLREDTSYEVPARFCTSQGIKYLRPFRKYLN